MGYDRPAYVDPVRISFLTSDGKFGHDVIATLD